MPALALIAFAVLQTSGRDMLAKSASAEFAAKSLSATCTIQHISPDSASIPSTSFTIDLAKPNKARIDLPDSLIVADGTTITTLDKAGKTFMRKPETDGELKALFVSEELAIFGSFFDPEIYNKIEAGKVAKKNRRGASYDSVDVTLSFESPEAASILLDPADKLAKIGEFKPANSKETTVVSAKTFTLDGTPADALFVFKAPADTHEITLADLNKKSTFEAPPSYFDKALETWHLCQTDPNGNLPGGGADYCGPTSSTNAITYLGLHGYPKLFQGDEAAAFSLDATLGSSNYMGTIPGEGTNPGHVMVGLRKYISEKGYTIESMAFEGWRWLEREVRSYKIADSIDMDWLHRGIATPNSAVLLNLGFYADNGNGTYTRKTGHWVTAVGYGSTGGGGYANPMLLIVHDPAKISSQRPKRSERTPSARFGATDANDPGHAGRKQPNRPASSRRRNQPHHGQRTRALPDLQRLHPRGRRSRYRAEGSEVAARACPASEGFVHLIGYPRPFSHSTNRPD